MYSNTFLFCSYWFYLLLPPHPTTFFAYPYCLSSTLPITTLPTLYATHCYTTYHSYYLPPLSPITPTSTLLTSYITSLPLLLLHILPTSAITYIAYMLTTFYTSNHLHYWHSPLPTVAVTGIVHMHMLTRLLHSDHPSLTHYTACAIHIDMAYAPTTHHTHHTYACANWAPILRPPTFCVLHCMCHAHRHNWHFYYLLPTPHTHTCTNCASIFGPPTSHTMCAHCWLHISLFSYTIPTLPYSYNLYLYTLKLIFI